MNCGQLATPKLGIGAAEHRRALDSRRGNRLGPLAAVCERQPRGQLAGRLFWGLAVKRHHRGGHARPSTKLGSPPVADGRNLDQIRTPADGLFEMVNGHVGKVRLKVRSVGDLTRLLRAIKRNGSRRRRPQPPSQAILGRSHRRKICAVRLSTRFSPSMHSFSTERAPKRSCRSSVWKVECGFLLE